MKYLNDAYTLTFETVVEDIVQYDSTYAIVLKDTFFYPEGGGQPADHGSIGEVSIIDVQIENDRIYHITDMESLPLLKGEKYQCKIDRERRLALMQQHTGQHLLSACAFNSYKAQTVGFHIGDDYVTVDLDKKLNTEEITSLEKEINDLIFSNHEVKTHYPTHDQLHTMPLRKVPKVEENIRVVEIDGVDFSPCGGTHLKSTSEIGLIKIRKFENYKAGVRIEFVCGLYALNAFSKQNNLINQLMQLYSAQEKEIYDYAESNLKQVKNLRKDLQTLERKCIEKEVESLISGYEDISEIKIIKLSEGNQSMNLLRMKVQMLMDLPNTIVLAHSIEGDKQHFVLSKTPDVDNDLKMNELFKKYLSSAGVKGGGNANAAQGGTLASCELDGILEKMIEEIESTIL